MTSFKQIVKEHKEGHKKYKTKMKEFTFEGTTSFEVYEKDFSAKAWYPSLDACMVAIKIRIEAEPSACGFTFDIVQRDHTP